jgi:hypothetical protein
MDVLVPVNVVGREPQVPLERIELALDFAQHLRAADET